MAKADSVFITPRTTAPKNEPSGLALQQRERQKTLKRLRKLREKASLEIERLITFLDASDPYASSELEAQIDDIACDDDTDAEPSLGSFDRLLNQEKGWSQVSEFCLPPGSDLEADNADDEPSLGSSIGGWGGHPDNQENWAAGGRDDRERDDAESGIGDHEGLLEQVSARGWQLDGYA